MNNSFLDYFIKNKEAEPTMVCLSSSGPAELVDYSKKDDRSSKVTYDGIGKVKYGSGIPPAVYDTAISAIKKFPIVYGCVTARADSIAGLNIKIFDVTGGQEREVKDHEFYRIYNNPNPYQGSFEFMEQISHSLDVTGNAFIAIEKGGVATGNSTELYLLPTKYVAIIPDPSTRVKEYHYYINGQSISYKPNEIIHIKYSDADDYLYGAPPLASAVDILTFEAYRIKFSNTYFKNSAIPVGSLITPQILSDNLLKKVRGEWERMHGGIDNSHKVAILTGGIEYKAITPPLKELDLGNLKNLSKDDILTIFKMPESILGSLDSSGNLRGKEALATFWRTSLIPHVKRIESALNRGLRATLFKQGKQTFRFDLKSVEALGEDKESVARYLQILVSSSIMTPQQAMAVVGLPPSEDPNSDRLMISNSMYGNAMMPADHTANPRANNAEKPTVKPPKATVVSAPVKPKV